MKNNILKIAVISAIVSGYGMQTASANVTYTPPKAMVITCGGKAPQVVKKLAGLATFACKNGQIPQAVGITSGAAGLLGLASGAAVLLSSESTPSLALPTSATGGSGSAGGNGSGTNGNGNGSGVGSGASAASSAGSGGFFGQLGRIADNIGSAVKRGLVGGAVNQGTMPNQGNVANQGNTGGMGTVTTTTTTVMSEDVWFHWIMQHAGAGMSNANLPADLQGWGFDPNIRFSGRVVASVGSTGAVPAKYAHSKFVKCYQGTVAPMDTEYASPYGNGIGIVSCKPILSAEQNVYHKGGYAFDSAAGPRHLNYSLDAHHQHYYVRSVLVTMHGGGSHTTRFMLPTSEVYVMRFGGTYYGGTESGGYRAFVIPEQTMRQHYPGFKISGIYTVLNGLSTQPARVINLTDYITVYYRHMGSNGTPVWTAYPRAFVEKYYDVPLHGYGFSAKTNVFLNALLAGRTKVQNAGFLGQMSSLRTTAQVPSSGMFPSYMQGEPINYERAIASGFVNLMTKLKVSPDAVWVSGASQLNGVG
jgi:hypothetical protein